MKDNWVVSVDIGASHVSAALVNTAGEIRDTREMLIHDPQDPAPLRLRLRKLAGDMIARARKAGRTPIGIAVGCPGIVDSKEGVLVVAGNLPELFGVPLGPELAEEFGLPVSLDNDVNARAAGEMVFGVARGHANFVLFSIGTDLGGGIVIDGQLHRGAHMVEAEFGHLTLNPDGPPCVCGGCGCAREWVSGAGLADMARAKLSANSSVLAAVQGDIEKITAPMIFGAGREGDAEAAALVEEFARRFGVVIANVMKVLDPELVVLAGEVCRSEPQVITRIIHWVRHYYFPLPQLPGFLVSEFTKESAVLGPAAAFFAEHYLPAGPECAPHPPRVAKTKRKQSGRRKKG